MPSNQDIPNKVQFDEPEFPDNDKKFRPVSRMDGDTHFKKGGKGSYAFGMQADLADSHQRAREVEEANMKLMKKIRELESNAVRADNKEKGFDELCQENSELKKKLGSLNKQSENLQYEKHDLTQKVELISKKLSGIKVPEHDEKTKSQIAKLQKC